MRAGILRPERQAHKLSFLALLDPGTNPEPGTTDHRVSRVIGMALSLPEFVFEQRAGILRIGTHSLLLELEVSSRSYFGLPGLRQTAAFSGTESRAMTTAPKPVGVEALKWQWSETPTEVFVAFSTPVGV